MAEKIGPTLGAMLPLISERSFTLSTITASFPIGWNHLKIAIVLDF